MDSHEAQTLKEAFELYRFVRSEVLPLYQGSQTPGVEAHLEDLKEMLLDLKQATIDLDSARAAQAIKEVLQVIGELNDRTPQE